MTETTMASTEAKSSPTGQIYDLNDPALYINREISLLEFNHRVLEEAMNPTNPLLERAKFLAIFTSNMDEFFMIRVAAIKQQIAAGITKMTADGLTPKQQLAAIRKKVRSTMSEINQCFETIQTELAETGVYLHKYRELTKQQREAVEQYFKNEIYPILTPLASDPGRPFPHISNLILNLAVIVKDPETGREYFARIKVPDTLPRLVSIRSKPSDSHNTHRFVWLEDLIAHNLTALFPGYEIVDVHQFRITRNADYEIESAEASDLLEVIEETVRRRHFGFVVRFNIVVGIPDSVRQLLEENFEVGAEDTYESHGPLNLNGLMELLKLDRPDLKYPPYKAVNHQRLKNITSTSQFFEIIRQGDLLLHHPYHSFSQLVDFLKAAAVDPRVLAIKQTLYRAGKNSPVVDALMEARENGKQVSALVELKARFDEESNIGWAKALESVGIHVLYGFASLKTHSKICLVVRRDEDGVLRRYVHLSTGNYNAVTANIYTDLGLFTCNPDFGADASDLFNALTGYSKKEDYKKFMVAPRSLRRGLTYLIDREIAWAQKGQPAKLLFKMNAVIDPIFIKHLYRASQAGVQIRMVARSVCGLRPGIPGLSDNIRVTSIIGRFLEHTRIYYFHNGGNPEVFLGSADLMQRNLDRRIETLFPIEDPKLKQEVITTLNTSLADNVQARLLHADGSYVRLTPAADETPCNSQLEFMTLIKNQ